MLWCERDIGLLELVGLTCDLSVSGSGDIDGSGSGGGSDSGGEWMGRCLSRVSLQKTGTKKER